MMHTFVFLVEMTTAKTRIRTQDFSNEKIFIIIFLKTRSDFFSETNATTLGKKKTLNEELMGSVNVISSFSRKKTCHKRKK